jgi:hypothetical protein
MNYKLVLQKEAILDMHEALYGMKNKKSGLVIHLLKR